MLQAQQASLVLQVILENKEKQDILVKKVIREFKVKKVILVKGVLMENMERVHLHL